MDDYDDTPMIYIGCIGVNKSMKTLKVETRSSIAKESIRRLCEANNIIKEFDNKRSDEIDHMLSKEPNLTNSGIEVELDVTSTHFRVITKESKEIIVEHEISNVSFASGGDSETNDFLAYVANDEKYGRACFVLRCGFNTAKDLLQTIARGFKLRTQQILNNSKCASPFHMDSISGFMGHTPLPKNQNDIFSFEANPKVNNENNQNDRIIIKIRESLENEPWYHGSYLTREQSEERLKKDGDFLVRESMFDLGQFVLSVMKDGYKHHLLFDSMEEVRTKDRVFQNISHLVKYHLDQDRPIVANNCSLHLYLKNGVRPSLSIKPTS